ncbi:MAG TPA: DNA-binding transcriptional regulator OxyR [Gammaproteobacteria bacterium]|nr:DNA-binding transcriptional regulator OxyR [Gammaproteobacteria bacterium]|tara:strand:- start:1268 stop:2167 length:900 start_codon:yes stop_codon:yes gene_type:complete
MNLRDLRYLVALAEHRHFGRAAEACFVSQPTLSTQIKKLEETLGATLIERTNRRVMLSPAGEQIVAQAQRILSEVNNLTELSEQLRDPLGGEVRLGIIPTVAPYLLPKILHPLKGAFPNLQVQLTEGQTLPLTQLLKRGELDAVLLALPLQEENIEEFELYRETFYLATSSNHRLANKKAASTADLEGEQVLLLEDGHCLRDQALAVCQAHHGEESKNYSATSLETLKQLVAADMGITLMPELAVAQIRNAAATGIRYIPFASDTPYRTLGLCWRSTSTRAELLRQLADELKQMVNAGG